MQGTHDAGHGSRGRESFVELNGLTHHVIEWGHGDDVVVLCHGFLDQAWSYRDVGERLAAKGLRAVAFDFRGHGETEWVGRGGYYHFPDYTMDLEALVVHLGVPSVHLVGHSMGGTVASMYAGVRPSRIRSLVLVEGLGPPPTELDATPSRFAVWMDGVERIRRRAGKTMATRDDAAERLRAAHRDLDQELAGFLASKATREIPGGFAWLWDPLHLTTSPVAFRLDTYTTFLGRITAPTLFLVGSRGMRLPDEDARLSHIKQARKIEIEDVGHMIHWFRADAVVDAISSQLTPR